MKMSKYFFIFVCYTALSCNLGDSKQMNAEKGNRFVSDEQELIIDEITVDSIVGLMLYLKMTHDKCVMLNVGEFPIEKSNYLGRDSYTVADSVFMFLGLEVMLKSNFGFIIFLIEKNQF